MMAVPDPVRVSTIPRRNVVENGRHDGELGVRLRRRLRGLLWTFAGQGGGEGHDVAEDQEHEGEGDELPAVGPDGVEFEITGLQDRLCWWAEPGAYADGVGQSRQTSEAIPEGCAEDVGVEGIDERHVLGGSIEML